MLPVGLCVQLACVWEATARKPGNIHRYRDFEDASYLDFILSAAAIAEPAVERESGTSRGEDPGLPLIASSSSPDQRIA